MRVSVHCSRIHRVYILGRWVKGLQFGRNDSIVGEIQCMTDKLLLTPMLCILISNKFVHTTI